MLKIKDPKKNGYEGAELDQEGKPVKIECDVLETIAYFVDLMTMPMASITMTYARADSKKNFKKAGPVTQHYITGDEMATILEDPAGITIMNMEASTLRTGIPSAHILPEDLEYDPTLPVWDDPTETLRKTAAELKKGSPPVPAQGMMPLMPVTGEQP